MSQSKKSNGGGGRLSPQAAKILEQYRNAGKTNGEAGNVDPAAQDDSDSRAPSSAPPAANRMNRSGTRGK